MTAPQSLAEAYIATTRALRASTESISQFIQADPENFQRLNELQRRREEAYQNWFNAASMLKNLPTSELANAIDHIETVLGYE